VSGTGRAVPIAPAGETEIALWQELIAAVPPWVKGSLSHADIGFLLHVVAAHAPRHVVEIGTGSGVSTGVISRGLAAAQAVTAQDYTVVSYDVSPHLWFDAGRRVGEAAASLAEPQILEHVTFRNPATALDAAREHGPDSLAFVFLDAMHAHPWPALDLLALLDCLEPGGIVVLHDINLPLLHAGEPAGVKWLFEELDVIRFVAADDPPNIGAIMVPTEKSGLRDELLRIVAAHGWESDVPDDLLRALAVPDTGRPSPPVPERGDTPVDLSRLLDRSFYERQAGEAFPDDESALRHYAEHGARRLLDPSPYFDTEFYFAQGPELLEAGVNPLEHYAHEAPEDRAHRPNPLFGGGYYFEKTPSARTGSVNPLLHYLEVGARLGQAASEEHLRLLRACGLGSGNLLARSRRKNRVVYFGAGGWPPEVLVALRELLLEQGLTPTFVFAGGSSAPRALAGEDGIVDLGQFGVRGLERPSALRFLARSLAARQPNVVFTELSDVVGPSRECGVPVYAVLPADETIDGWGEAAASLADLVERVIVPSSESFHRLRTSRDANPTNVALRAYSPGATQESPTGPSAARAFARSILDLARRDGFMVVDDGKASLPSTRRVVVLCSDWGLSGVNSAMEAVGKELRSRGWDLELLFTRDQSFVEESAGPSGGLPDLPYRYLDRGGAGVELMWQQLIDDLADAAPCILLIAYDFFGNSVVPALTNDIGVVMWAQADDGDYYEQAYRLGRYCNAIICVSSRIREKVASIHPGIGDRTRVIHNTSIRDADILPRAPRSSDRLRIIYTGRLVQYQKRVLDFVLLADELEALGLDFTLDLVGGAPPAHDEAAALLPQRAARHVEAGRMRLLGRLARPDVLEELRSSDLFVLLSDFEGLPLSLIEAMAAGCVPVVAEMESGISEVLVPDESGVIVQGRDYGAWARTIRDLWTDKERLADMAERAQQAVRGSFTIERIADQFETLLREVAEELANGYQRPPALTWGTRRAPFGDVLPPPPMYRAVPLEGLK
jgi:glycosyltransferase involved in cell wall biosynthesis/predicted O-methyltransferase YrrM